MKLVDVPSRFNIPFADAAGGGYIRPIPEASQIGVENGAASLTDGFPPLTFLPVGAGGYPPFGQDFNGLFKQVTEWNQWQAAGGLAPYDATFSTAIGGYPKNAVLMADSTTHLWLNEVDDNTTDPDTGGANWIPLGLAATQGEVDAGTRDDVYVSPSTLDGYGPGYADLTLSMPIYFNIESSGNTLAVTSPSTGTVRVPAGKIFTWRGVRRYTTAQTDLSTTLSKTYHLRWDVTNGFALYDLSNLTYNPSGLAETSSAFDTTYDSMLVARVVTNGSNVSTITNLVNLASLADTQYIAATGITSSGLNGATGSLLMTINWARTPIDRTYTFISKIIITSPPDADIVVYNADRSGPAGSIPATRYQVAFAQVVDCATAWTLAITVGA